MSLKKSPQPRQKTHKYGITGGIGSGKSYVCRSIEAAGYPVFYCDDEARRIIRTDADVRAALTALIGTSVYDEEGLPVKSVLSAYIRSGKEHADQVNAIVHPRVAEAFESWSWLQPSPAVFMECALLFEARFDRFVDTSILVKAPLETRISRIMNRDGASRQQALEWMALQMPEEEKEQRANYIINNDGVAEIAPQLQRIINNSYF